MIVAGPVTKSPTAKMPSLDVPNVSALMLTYPRLKSNVRSFIGRPSASFGVLPLSGGLRQLDTEPPSTTLRVSVTPMCRLSFAPYAPRTLLSAAWLVQGMTMSQGTTKSEPGIGSALRRPVASGGPRRVRTNRTPATLPSGPAMISSGELKYSNCTPSKRVSCCSSSSTTISSGPRR